MNRSCRRAATVAAGVLYVVGWATLGAVGASADSGHDGAGADRVAVAPAKRGFRVALPPVPPAGALEEVPCPPCPFCPPCPIWPVNWWTKNRNSHAEIFEPPAVFVPRPVTAISATSYTTPTIDHYLADLVPEASAGLAAAGLPAPVVGGPSLAGPSLGGPLIPYPAPTPAPPTPAPHPPAEPPASPVSPPVSAPAQAGPPPTGAVAGQAPLAQLALLALPGVAGLAGLTGLGSYLGYRQAKAGFALRAAGTARFLA